MNRRTFCCLAGLGFFAFLGWSTGQLLVPRAISADETPAAERPAAKPCDVAVLDMGKVFKEYNEFKKAMDLLKTESDEFQARGRAQQAELQQRAEAAKALKEGSEPRLQEELKLAKMSAELKLESTVKQKQLMEAEAKLYYRTYLSVCEATAAYAKSAGIRVVVRYSSEPINPDDRNSILSGVNSAIIFQDQIDITGEIIRRVNNLPSKS
jgi:Skp family chaperone for outer membrane proteins